MRRAMRAAIGVTGKVATLGGEKGEDCAAADHATGASQTIICGGASALDKAKAFGKSLVAVRTYTKLWERMPGLRLVVVLPK